MRTVLLGATLLLALGLPASAQDACLTGASTLGDQRALATLRADTEAACPCADAASRKAYQHCARDVLLTALDMGTLRAECKRSAIAIDKGAVCGSTKIACGRFTPSADDPRSCRVRAASRCEDRRRYEQHPCSNETYCVDVVDWTASTCSDVRDDGPFAPGVRVITFTKQSVATYCQGGSGNCTAKPYGAGCYCTGPGDCASGTCSTEPRPLQTVIWYPAVPGSGPIDPTYKGVLDAPIDPSAGPCPLLMFSHGSCGYPYQSTFLTPRVASYGFVVAAPPHPKNTIFDFPNCGTPGVLVSSAAERPADVRFVLDQLLAADQDPASPFLGTIDEDRVGMSGHSFGGFTTYLAVAQDARFKVAVPMAPAVPGTPMLSVPSLTMLGQIDSVVSLPPVRTAYADAQPPKYLVEIEHAGHYAFSDGCFPSPDCNPPTTLTQDEAHDFVRRYALPFLEVYLAGDTTFTPFLVPPPIHGVVLQSQS